MLGPNGAGKTTTLSMMCCLLKPDGGRILFDGIDLAEDPIGIKAQLGVVPQETALYEELSARENLLFWGGLYDMSGSTLKKAVDGTLELLGLAARAREPVKKFSGGMKRRLNLGIGLVHSPRAVLLDEPTVGIDPQARNALLDVVRDIAASGTTVVYTTHYLDEAETLCNRIGIIDHGKLLVEGILDELNDQAGEEELVSVRVSFDVEEARARLEQVPHARLVSAEPGKVVLSAGGSGKAALETRFRNLSERPRLVDLEVSTAGLGRPVPSGIAQSVPGVLTMSVLMCTLIYGAVFLTMEKSDGTLRRQMTLPVGRTHVFAGKLLGRMLLTLAQIVVLLLAGQFLFGLAFEECLPGLLLLMPCYALSVTGLSTLLGAVLKTPEQAGSLGWLVAMGMASLGGCWWPSEVMPRWLWQVAHAFPTAWAMDGFHSLISFGRGIEGVWVPCLVLVGFGILFSALGIRFLKTAGI